MAMNLRLAFQSFREPRAPRLDDGLLSLPLMPIAGCQEGCLPASLEFGTVIVLSYGHWHSCRAGGRNALMGKPSGPVARGPRRTVTRRKIPKFTLRQTVCHMTG